MRLLFLFASILIFAGDKASAQGCTPAGARAPAGTLAAPAPPCRPAEQKDKGAKIPDMPKSQNGHTGFYVGGSLGMSTSTTPR